MIKYKLYSYILIYIKILINDLAKIKLYIIENINDIPVVNNANYDALFIGINWFHDDNNQFYGVLQFDYYWFHIRFEVHNISFYIYTKYGDNAWKVAVVY